MPIQKPKIGETTKQFTNALHEQLTIAMADDPKSRLHLIIEFKLPGEGTADYCYYPPVNGVPVVLMLQGPKNTEGVADCNLLPGKKTAIMLLNDKLAEDKGPLGEWGVRLIFNRKSRSLMIYGVHLDHISEFLAKEASLAPKQQFASLPTYLSASAIAEAEPIKTITLDEYKALKARKITPEQAEEEVQMQAAIAASQAQAQADEWTEATTKKAKKAKYQGGNEFKLLNFKV